MKKILSAVIAVLFISWLGGIALAKTVTIVNKTGNRWVGKYFGEAKRGRFSLEAKGTTQDIGGDLTIDLDTTTINNIPVGTVFQLTRKATHRRTRRSRRRVNLRRDITLEDGENVVIVINSCEYETTRYGRLNKSGPCARIQSSKEKHQEERVGTTLYYIE